MAQNQSIRVIESRKYPIRHCKDSSCRRGYRSRDISSLRQQVQINFRTHINDKLPEEYQNCMVGINQVLKICREIVNKSRNVNNENSNGQTMTVIDNKTVLQALALINDCNKYKMLNMLFTHLLRIVFLLRSLLPWSKKTACYMTNYVHMITYEDDSGWCPIFYYTKCKITLYQSQTLDNILLVLEPD